MKLLPWLTVVAAATCGAGQALGCSLALVSSAEVKDVLVPEIALHTGLPEDFIPTAAVSTPLLQMPLALGADCSGLHSWYWHAHFEFEDTIHSDDMLLCIVRGQAILMGHDPASNPASVHFAKVCRPRDLK